MTAELERLRVEHRPKLKRLPIALLASGWLLPGVCCAELAVHDHHIRGTESDQDPGRSESTSQTHDHPEDAPSAGGLNGDPLPYVPEWSFSIGGDYDWSLSGGSMAYIGGTVGYTGDRPSSFRNRNPIDDSIIEASSYTLVNLRAGIEIERWTVELYGSNLTNEYGGNSVNSNSLLPNGAFTVGLIRPRTYGVSATVKF